MRVIETDYLVVGAGASGMAFVDALVSTSDAEVVLVDRRHAPGGHWLDAYPFVRLHSPSANYGVASRPLGQDRIDEAGPNAGFYERASGPEVCDYFARALDSLTAAKPVCFLGVSDYRGSDEDGHHVVSLLTGAETVVKVRRQLVDATYVESSIPSRHTPTYAVDPDVRLIPPNDLIDLGEPAAGFTVIGAGKTAMDTCNWLLDSGVDPEQIEWIRPRDPWMFNRAHMQPLDLVGGFLQLQARWVEGCAEVEDSRQFAHHLESHGILGRIDPEIEPDAFRGAIVSPTELDSMRSIERVVRGRLLRIAADEVTMEHGSVATDPGRVYVDCTAAGVRPTKACPIFAPDRITLQYVTLGNVPWGAATIGVVEASGDDDTEKNRLCPPLQFTGYVADLLSMARTGMLGLLARGAEPELAAWSDSTRLNPSHGAAEHMHDPSVAASLTTIAANIGPAVRNLERVAGSVSAQ